MIYYGPKQRGRRKTLMTAVSFSLRLADLGAEEKNVPTHTNTQTHTSSRTQTYTYKIYIYIFIHRSSWENVQRFLFLYTYMMRVVVYAYRKYIYKKHNDNFQLLRDNRVILYGVNIQELRRANRRKNNTVRPRVGAGVDGSGGVVWQRREKKVQCSTRIISRLEFFRPVGLTVRVLHLPRAAAAAHELAPA